MIEAVASAMPSIMPTVKVEVPRTVTRYSGSSAWIISDETSMNIDTKPSAQTLPGISRHRRSERGCSGITPRSYAGLQRLEAYAAFFFSGAKR